MRRKRGSIFPLLVAMWLSVACIPTRTEAVNWQPVVTFTGYDNSQTTDLFRINGSEWRINWSYTPHPQQPSLTAFSLFVYPNGEENVYVEHVIEYGSGNTSGTVYVHEGIKLYYMKIVVANTRGYSIAVECDLDSVVGTGILIAIIVAVFAIPAVIIVVVVHFARRKAKRMKNLPPQVPPPLPPPPPPTATRVRI